MSTERVTQTKIRGWTQVPEAGAPWERFDVPAELNMAIDEARGRELPAGTVVVLSSSSHHEYLRSIHHRRGMSRTPPEEPDAPAAVLWEGVSLGGSAVEDAPRLSDPRRQWVSTWLQGNGPLLLTTLGRATRGAFVRGVCAIAGMCIDPNQSGAEGKAARDAARRALEIARKWGDGRLGDDALALHMERIQTFDCDFARVSLLAIEAAQAHPHASGEWARELSEAAAASTFRVAIARAYTCKRGRASMEASRISIRDYELRIERQKQGDVVREAVALGEVMLGHALAAREDGAM